MSKRSKLLAAKDRARRALEKAEEAKALEAGAKKLRSLQGGFARKGSNAAPDLKARMAREQVEQKYGTRYDVPDFLPAKADPAPKSTVRERMSPEMQAREQKAKQHGEAIKARTAPLYNKGPYGYYTDDMYKDLQAGGTRRC